MTNHILSNQPNESLSYWLKHDLMQTHKEEFVNTLIHALGIVFGIFALFTIFTKTYDQQNIYKTISGIVFASSIIITYLASVLYHSCPHPQLKKHFRLFDHLTIYIMIAGSYTPFMLVTLQGGAWGWPLFIGIWTLALLGGIYKLFFINTFENLSQFIYLLMGWISICVIKPLLHVLAINGFFWLLAGGLLYTIGILFYRKDHIYHYYHAIWHIFVLAGTACHFYSIYFYVLS